jgi:hypothetical protein
MIVQIFCPIILPYHFSGPGSILAQFWFKSGSMAIPAWFKLVQLVQMANGGSTHLARFGGPGTAYGYEKSV